MLDDHPKYLDDLTIRLPTDCESNYPLMPNSSHPIRWQFPAGASKTAVTGVNLRGGSSQSGGFIPVKRICRLSNERGRERERGDNGERKECAHYNKIDAGASRARGSNKTRFCVATANKDRTTQLRYSAMRRGARRMREKERNAGKTERKKGERRGRRVQARVFYNRRVCKARITRYSSESRCNVYAASCAQPYNGPNRRIIYLLSSIKWIE